MIFVGSPITYHSDLHGESHLISPGITERVRQVEQEVDEAPTGGCQICPTEEHTDEEALHDGGHAEY